MWVTSQRAERMIAAHWPVGRDVIAALLPPAVRVDTAEGTAWVTLIGMQVAGARPRFLPPIGPLSTFGQVGVRTYVRVDDRPAAWIIAGLAGGRLGAVLARRAFRLPFVAADVHVDMDGSGECTLVAGHGGRSVAVSWAPSGEAATPAIGSLTAFLGERDVVLTATGGSVWAGRVAHDAVPVAPADVVVAENTLGLAALPPDSDPALAHAIATMRTHAWLPHRLRTRP